ncbi:uncharacterized protein CEXT_406121 [Caerostris extrusa]|uniref:Flagellar FliJ protein n=1 Tax=Caerostris extrusa TaxID=172846 RepID=A0AAV4NGD4_CAEEX|nr:uncharacterized protein CEXT_406121 [Caerostris extrusa]
MLKSESYMFEFSSITSEIRRLQVKQEHVLKEQEKQVQQLRRGVYIHTNLYIEADKQALFGKRRKAPEYVQKKIKYALKKIQDEKKELEILNEKINSLYFTESELNDACETEQLLTSEMIKKN